MVLLHRVRAHLDGELKQTTDVIGILNEVTGAIQATIGAGRKFTYPLLSTSLLSDGYGKLFRDRSMSSDTGKLHEQRNKLENIGLRSTVVVQILIMPM